MGCSYSTPFAMCAPPTVGPKPTASTAAERLHHYPIVRCDAKTAALAPLAVMVTSAAVPPPLRVLLLLMLMLMLMLPLL
jgi:hypothetical protein